MPTLRKRGAVTVSGGLRGAQTGSDSTHTPRRARRGRRGVIGQQAATGGLVTLPQEEATAASLKACSGIHGAGQTKEQRRKKSGQKGRGAIPPFSLKNWGAEQFASDPYGRNIWGTLTDKTAADLIWLQHMVCSMDPHRGRCAVILPQGVLFHGGKEGAIRKQLVQSDKLDCVITLASGVFYSTGVSACILLLKNDKEPSHRGRICLIDGSQVFTPQRAQNIVSEENADELFGLYDAYEDVIERCRVVTLQDIKKQGYTLQVSSYIERKREEAEPPEKVRARFLDLLDETRAAEERFHQLLAEGGYLDER